MGPNFGTAIRGSGIDAPRGTYKTGGGTVRWPYAIPRHERQRTGISARQQRRRRTARLRLVKAMRKASVAALKMADSFGATATAAVRFSKVLAR